MKKTHLYFPINKCASTSFKKIFSKYNHILIPNLDTNNNSNTNLHLMKDKYNLFFKFTIIRHPIDRFISAVNMFIRDNKIKPDCPIEEVINIIKNKNQSYTLNNYTNKAYIKRHTLPLSHKLYCLLDNNDNIICDYIIKLEEIHNKKKWNNFTETIKINEKTLNNYSNKTTKILTINDLTKEELSFLYEYYKKDFVIFNYDKYQ